MTAAWLLARSRLRRRSASAVAVVLIAGIGAGAVGFAVAAARRGDRALPAFVAFTRSSTATSVLGAPPDPDLPDAFSRYDQAGTVADIGRLEGVRRTVRTTALIVRGLGEQGAGPPRRLLVYAALDPGIEALGRWKVVRGRDLDERAPDEVVVSEGFAEREHLRPGSTYRVAAYTLDQFGPAGEGTPIPAGGRPVDLKVVGIVRTPAGLVPQPAGQDSLYVSHDELYVGAGFWRAHGPDIARYGIGVGVVLAPGMTVSRLRGEITEAFGSDALETRYQIESGDSMTGAGSALGGIQRAISVESRSLLGFAAVAAVAVLALLYQALGRLTAAGAESNPILGAIGVNRRTVVAATAFELLPAALLSGLAAGVVTVATSSLAPIGIARRAELHPGLAVDGRVVALVAAGAGLAVLGLGLLLVRPLTARDRWSGSRSRLGAVTDRLPIAAATGVRFAVRRGRGRSTAPVRSPITAVASAALATLALAGLASSLGRLVHDPASYGINWDAAVGNFASLEADRDGARLLEADHDVAAFAGVNIDDYLIGSGAGALPVTGVELSARKGHVFPVISEGRAPVGPDEVALGTVTMRQAGVGIGDPVRVRIEGAGRELRVVGRAVIPAVIGDVPPGKGMLLDAVAATTLEPQGPTGGGSAEVSGQAFVVRLVPGVDRSAAIHRLAEAFPQTLVTPFPPSDIANLQRVAALPGVLAGLLAAIGMAGIAHAVAVTVQRRRSELAVLRCLGFRRRDVTVSLVSQGLTLTFLGLVIGAPLGVAAGRRLWALLARQIGVDASPAVSATVVAGVLLAALVITNMAVTLPALRARLLRPAEVLRTSG